jgi:hypothetical protein
MIFTRSIIQDLDFLDLDFLDFLDLDLLDFLDRLDFLYRL